MVRELPTELQHHFTKEVLNSLASSLLDGTIFEIVNNLYEMQLISEKKLYDDRQKIEKEYNRQRSQLLQRHKTTEKAWEVKPHQLSVVQAANKRELSAFDKRMTDELHRFDLKIMNEFDSKVSEQQDTMNKVGIVGFNVTNNKDEIVLQMHLFSMIQRLYKMNLPPI
jgi:hypothetical protein